MANQNNQRVQAPVQTLSIQIALRSFSNFQLSRLVVVLVRVSGVAQGVTGTRIDNTFYKKIVGSLMYLTVTRPDIMYSVSLISRYLENSKETHLLAAKRILRYLQGTNDLGILYRKRGKSNLIGFTNSNFAGDKDDRKSTSGYVFMFGSGAISLCSKKQPTITLSTTEAEFMAATVCATQAI
ncbi:secreted RxLR effector protein 161-like [Solanum stenotomum]|uniref:secreted RxLR effector protein 161-like n=1 Tax=Solanum stenotomum TaxID=172797 RepID=UPI0020D063D3|nr:secreted RxLR effector protein 161-like [Solanum stenotomum]